MGQSASSTSTTTNAVTTNSNDYISYATVSPTPSANAVCKPYQTLAPPLVIPNVGTIHCGGVASYYDNCCVEQSVLNYDVSVNGICQQQYAPPNCIKQAQENFVSSYCNCERSAQPVPVPAPTPTPPAKTCVVNKPANLTPCENACWMVDYRNSRVVTGCYDSGKIQACTLYCNSIKPLANDVCKKSNVYPNSQAGYGICVYITVNLKDAGSGSAPLYNAVVHDIMGTTPPALCGKETCCVKGCNITLNNQVQAYGGPAINEYQTFEKCIASCDPHEICPPPTAPNVPLSQYCNCGIPADCHA